RDTQRFAQLAQRIGFGFGKVFFAQRKCVYGFPVISITEFTEFLFEHPVIKTDVMPYEDGSFRYFNNPFGDFVKSWCSTYHFGGDPGVLLHIGINFPVGFYEGSDLICNFFPIIQKYGNFYDRLLSTFSARGFNINYSVHFYLLVNFPKSPRMIRFPAVLMKLLVRLFSSTVSSIPFSFLGLPGVRFGEASPPCARLIFSVKIS